MGSIMVDTQDGKAHNPFAKFFSRTCDSFLIHHVYFSRPEWGSREKKPNMIKYGCRVCLTSLIFLNSCGLKHLRWQCIY